MQQHSIERYKDPQPHPPGQDAESQFRARLAMAALLMIGIGVRLVLAWLAYPVSGDPLLSYSYRAMLIGSGQWEGLFLTWHQPFFPLVGGLLVWASGGYLHAYWACLSIDLASVIVLVWAVDRLARICGARDWTRVAIASFLLFQETFVVATISPQSEPMYLALYALALLVASREGHRMRDVVLAGALTGLAMSTRVEGVAVAAGLVAYLFASQVLVGDAPAVRTRLRLTVGFVLGVLATAWWLCFNVSRLRSYHAAANKFAVIPVVHGFAENLMRGVRLAYFALTDWLPQVVLLAFWMVASAGMLGTAIPSGRARRVYWLLLLTVVPQFVLVVASGAMYKRTGLFLFPALALSFGLGVEVIGRRVAGIRWLPLVTALAIAMNLLQSLRVIDYVKSRISRQPNHSYVQARMLMDSGQQHGEVFAFGSEAEIYSVWNVPIVFDFPNANARYAQLYDQNRGKPAWFLDALRDRGVRYLTIIEAVAAGTDIYGPYLPAEFIPDPKDVREIVDNPAAVGLRLIDQRTARGADGSDVAVHLFEVRGSQLRNEQPSP